VMLVDRESVLGEKGDDDGLIYVLGFNRFHKLADAYFFSEATVLELFIRVDAFLLLASW
jgi:hypothetical protein